jgi:NAD(P)-dependent dehydrogenase (short-subunit alcohol dehydrogenase family)
MPTCFSCCAGLAVIVALLLAFADQFTRVRGTLWVLHAEPYRFRLSDVPDLRGKVVLVTGGNSGLGFYTATHLADRGAMVAITCRRLQKCSEAKQQIEAKLGKPVQVEPWECDLTSYASILRFARAFREKHDKLDSLVLNAGIMQPPFELAEGVESQFFVNHVAHTYLALLLLDLVVKAQPSTVVAVSSLAHWRAPEGGVKLSLEAINDPAQYDGSYYGQSKLANIFMANHLDKVLRKERVFVNSMHPGGVKGGLAKHRAKGHEQLYKLVSEALYWSDDDAALTVLALAVGREVPQRQIRGKYFVPVFREDAGSPLLRNQTLEDAVWAFTMDILKGQPMK